jgi:hypothetical protein
MYSGSPQHEVCMRQDWIKVLVFNLYLTAAGTAIYKINSLNQICLAIFTRAQKGAFVFTACASI